MAVVTPAGVLLHGNAALDRLLACPRGALVGRTLFEVTHPDDLEAARWHCQEMQSGRSDLVQHECRFLRPDGTAMWVLVTTSRAPAVSDQPAHLVMHIQDITERTALAAELAHRALHDPLTGLPNRALLLDRVAHAVGRSRRTSRPTAVFFLDLDGFKAVNDDHGHACGDDVLRTFADRLRALLRPGDTAARLGGDEFVVVCEDTDDRAADQVIERLRQAAGEPFTVQGQEVRLSTAVGGAVWSPHDGPEPDPQELLRRADQSMYADKRRTRRRTVPAQG